MVDLPGNPDDPVAGDCSDEDAGARDDKAEARDRRAETRDDDANARDAAADERDRAAEAGGDLTTFDRPAAQPTDRTASPAASDRTMASRDRTEGLSDRAEAAGDRHAASADRGASAGDRTAAALDELTGAHRRGAGLVELEREMARARRTREGLVVAFVDVNGLKAINDSRGHSAGDQVLRAVVATLRAKLRAYDLIIRFGGDEFLCVIPGVSVHEAVERLASVNATLAATPENGSVTTGLASLQANDSFQDLIARADAALYQKRQQHPEIDLTSSHQRQVDPTAPHEPDRER